MKKNKKLKRILIVLVLLAIIGIVIWQIPTIADWGDYESYDSSSSYDDWGSSSSDWDDDYSYSSGYHSSSSSSGDLFWIGYFLGRHPVFTAIIIFVIVCIVIYTYKNKNITDEFLRNYMNQHRNMMNRPSYDVEEKRRKNREILFGVDDSFIEKEIQTEDPLFNKAEFLVWASDMFVKLQYAWSDRNLENIRHFVTPELFEQTNNQVQRYITNKQINKLERVSVNLSRLYEFSQEGDREILRIVLESKMIDYIVDESTGKTLRGDPAINVVNPYILTFVRKVGMKTPEGGVKPVTMNCPNCGGATTILSSGKCPYCGSIITTRDNNWTLSEMKRYNPNA